VPKIKTRGKGRKNGGDVQQAVGTLTVAARQTGGGTWRWPEAAG